jgi:hypothetical protein
VTIKGYLGKYLSVTNEKDAFLVDFVNKTFRKVA